MAMKKILITGGNGLIGSSLVNQSLNKGYEVLSVDQGNPEHIIDSPNYVFKKIDITSDNFPILIEEFAPNYLIHCAAHPGGKSLIEPYLDIEVNILATMKIIETCSKTGAHLIYLSSSVIYGEHSPDLIKEGDQVKPGTIYGVAKQACENLLRIYEQAFGLKWTVLRLFATYGSGHKPNTFQGIVNIFLTQIMNGNNIIVKGSLKRKRDMVYVEDACEGIMACINNDKALSRIINIGTGQPLEIKELIEKICIALDRDIESLNITEEEGTIGDPFYNSADCSLASEILNYQPNYTIDDGLKLLTRERLG
jgi:UDP-glucose 4-epimerase